MYYAPMFFIRLQHHIPQMYLKVILVNTDRPTY